MELVLGGVFSELGGVASIGPRAAGWGWELVLLAGGAALIAYSVVAGQAGPGYLGALNLFSFGLLAAVPGEDGASLIGWPLVLIIATIGAVRARPRQRRRRRRRSGPALARSERVAHGRTAAPVGFLSP